MGFFAGNESVEVCTHINGNVTKEQAIKVLHELEMFIKFNKDYQSHKEVALRNGGKPTLPDDVKTVGPTKAYEATDAVPERFAKLLPGKPTTINYYELTPTADGVFTYIESALDVKLGREYLVQDDPAGGLRLVEKGSIACNKVLMSVVKGQQEENWQRIHAEYITKMGGTPGEHAVLKVG